MTLANLLRLSLIPLVGLLSSDFFTAPCGANPNIEGACCFPDCTCWVMTHEDCDSAGGLYMGDWTVCEEVVCPCPGACCLPGGECLYILNLECTELGGTHGGYGSDCDPNPCRQIGACCADLVCEVLYEDECAALGGIFYNAMDSCAPGICAPDSLQLDTGCLLAHAPASASYSQGSDWCAWYEDSPLTSWEDQNPHLEPTGTLSSWCVIAAFGGLREFCEVSFGFGAYDEDIYFFTQWGSCLPDAFPASTGAWPGPNEGVMIATVGAPWHGDLLPVYYFVGYAYYQGEIPLGNHPPSGQARFTNCLDPEQAQDIACLGSLGIGIQGQECTPPAVPVAVCCLSESCQLMTAHACLLAGGNWLEGWTTCDPNPCQAQHIEPPSHGRVNQPRLSGSPNPFTRHVAFEIPCLRQPSAEPTAIKIYDVTGTLVRTLPVRATPNDPAEILWDGIAEDGTPVGPGVYFCRLRPSGLVRPFRVVLLR